MVNLKTFIAKRLRDLRIIWGSKSGKAGLILAFGFIIVALLAPWISPYDPNVSSGRAYLPPSLKHFLGTDDIGNDLLSQLIWGTRGSLLIGLSAGAIATVVGAGIGLIAG